MYDIIQANRGTGKNMATLNNKFIFFALTSEFRNHSCSVVLSQMAFNRLIFDVWGYEIWALCNKKTISWYTPQHLTEYMINLITYVEKLI
jgi:hypothetical protein